MKKQNIKNETPNPKKVWVYVSTDREADNADEVSAVSVFATREEAFACMENTMDEDIESGIVNEDDFGGEKTERGWTAVSSDDRFCHRVFSAYVQG